MREKPSKCIKCRPEVVDRGCPNGFLFSKAAAGHIGNLGGSR